MESTRLLLFDLDGTLLRSDKTISQRTLETLKKCRDKGVLIGICTSRGEQNTLSYLDELQPDIAITSGGALVKYNGDYVYKAEFSPEETNRMIAEARKICGAGCGITIDTIDFHYQNYQADPKKQPQGWGDDIYTDFHDFKEPSLKLCVEIFDSHQAQRLQEALKDCDCIRFSDGYWYKSTRKNVTKEQAIMEVRRFCGIGLENITAFGDDYADIGMLEMCGTGIAMGNAISEVKAKADLIIGSNDGDGIAAYLEQFFPEHGTGGKIHICMV